jgi:hypothetical protein
LVVGQLCQVAPTVRIAELGQQAGKVQRLTVEDQLTVTGRPLVGVAVPGKLNTVAIRIVQLDSFMGAVVGGAIDTPAGVEQPS